MLGVLVTAVSPVPFPKWTPSFCRLLGQVGMKLRVCLAKGHWICHQAQRLMRVEVWALRSIEGPLAPPPGFSVGEAEAGTSLLCTYYAPSTFILVAI